MSKHPEEVLQKRRYKNFKEKNKSTISLEKYKLYEEEMKKYKENKVILNVLKKRLNLLKPKQHKSYNQKLSFAEKKARLFRKYNVSPVSQNKYKNYNKIESLRYKIRYDYDINFNLKERLRRQLKKKAHKYPHLGDMLRQDIKKGKNRIYTLLNYTTEDLLKHLQNMFTDGMSLDELIKGNIHIDHVVPQSWFDLNNDEDVKKCWALENLQPLWAKDNLKKSDKMILTEHNIKFNSLHKLLYENKMRKINANKNQR